MSIDETRAREAVFDVLDDVFGNLYVESLTRTDLTTAGFDAADRLLDPVVFARVAGLLGYAKADSWLWGVEFGGGWINMHGFDERAARAEVATSGGVLVRVPSFNWEVVSDGADA